MPIDQVVIRLVALRESCLSLGRLHREHLDAFPVEQELHIVRFVQPLDVLVAISRQPNLDFVFAVEWKRVVGQGPAARADRQALEMFLLREVRLHPDRRRRPESRWGARPPPG